MEHSGFTYEEKNNKSPLETLEWDNVWWHRPEEAEHNRILYIGDSISCAVRRLATRATNEKYYFDGFGTSKAVDNPHLKESVLLFAKQQTRRDAVLFNNGLHGWHLNEDEYEAYYEEFVKFLLEAFAGIKLVLLLTTGIVAPQTEERINRTVERNERVLKIAKKYGLPVIDLYSQSVEYAQLHTDDGVHFSGEGSQKLAEKIACEITEILSD